MSQLEPQIYLGHGDTLDRRTLIIDLLGAANKIRIAEHTLLVCTRDQQAAKDRPQGHEARLILNGTCTGKNQAERDAQMREHTLDDQELLREAEANTATARVELTYQQHWFSALRTVAGLLGPEVTP